MHKKILNEAHTHLYTQIKDIIENVLNGSNQLEGIK